MHPNRAVRILGGATHLLTHPQDLVALVGDVRSREEPMARRLPWIPRSAIRFLDRHVKPGMRIFEWGGGGSTLFFLDRGAIVHTVEDHPAWSAKLKETIEATPHSDRWTLHQIPVEPDESEYVTAINRVDDEGGWDLVFIDGVCDTRLDCMRNARPHLKPDGVLLLDDAWRPRYAASDDIMKGYRRSIHKGTRPFRPFMSRTDSFSAANGSHA